MIDGSGLTADPAVAFGLALCSVEETLQRVGAPFAPRRVGIACRVVRRLRKLAVRNA